MFRIASTDADRLACMIVRGIVFIEEQQVAYDEEIDEHDAAGGPAATQVAAEVAAEVTAEAAAAVAAALAAATVHILGELDGEPVAAGRLRFVDGWAKLERICVRRAWRGDGHGRRLVEFMLGEARRLGYRRFRMHAQQHLAEFYAGHGFAVSGPPFQEAGIAHVLMVREELSGPSEG